MNIRTMGAIALVAAGALLGGCATNRSEVKVSGPAPATTQVAVTKERAVVIRSIKDDRQWTSGSGDPAQPSLGFEGAAAATEATKARAIARKRNGFGQAMGD